MIDAPLTEIAAALAARRVSSIELTRSFLDRIAREIQRILLPSEAPAIDGFEISGINIPASQVSGDYFDYITVDPDRSLAQAAAADARIARGEGGPLTGIPIAHKDIFCARGWLTTCASRKSVNSEPPKR